MARKKKKRYGESSVPVERYVYIGAGVFAGLMAIYLAAFFMLTEVRVTENQFVKFRTRVCHSVFARQFFRPILGVEKRLYLDYGVEVEDGHQPPPPTDALRSDKSP